MTSARRSIVAALVTLTASGAGLALSSPSVALAADSFLPLPSFGSAGSGAGQFESPGDVAVEASTGDVFVMSGVNVNDIQTVTLSGATSGNTFRLTFEGQSTGAEGKGELEEESKVVHVSDVTGHFAEGEAISGEGIKPGTLVEEVSGSTVRLTKAAEEGIGTKTGVSLKADLPYNATTAAIQTALNELSAINGAVRVRGVEGGPYSVEFGGEFKEKAVPAMTCTAGFSGLSGTCAVANAPASNTLRVEKFDKEGNYLGEITPTGAPTPFKSGGGGIAVDNSSSPYAGDIYVWAGENGGKGVYRFSPTAGHANEYEYDSDFAHGEQDIAVNPANGDLYTLANPYFYEYEPSEPNTPLYEQELEFGNYPSLAVSGDYVYPVKLSVSDKLVLERYTQNVVTGELEEQTVIKETPFVAGHGVTVDPASGDVFALEEESAGHSHVVVYTASGTPTGETFGTGTIGASEGIAYSAQGNGRIYVSDLTNSDVHVFEREKPLEAAPELTGCAATTPTPNEARVKCTIKPNATKAEWKLEYREHGSQGSFVVSAKGEVTTEEAVEGKIGGLRAESKYEWHMTVSNPEIAAATGEFKMPPYVEGVEPCTASGVQREMAALGGSMLTTIGDVPVEWYFEYSEEGSPTLKTPGETGAPPVAAQASIEKLEPNAEYECRLVASDTYGTTVGPGTRFKTLPAPPVVESSSTSGVTRTVALLAGTIDPEHSATTYRFEYGTTPEYEAITPPASAGGGYGKVEVGPQALTNLLPETTYHYRIVAENEYKEVAVGPDQTFVTAPRIPPLVSTGTASAVTQTTATISGTVDPQGVPTRYEFEVGTDTSYSGAPMFGDAGEGESAEPIAVTLEGLAPDTTYHYRLSASSADGEAPHGQDMTFTTLAVPSPIVQPLTPPLLATPNIAFPAETGTSAKTTTKALTRAQELAKALKACNRDRFKRKRASCEQRARKKYGAKAKARKQHKRKS